MQKDNIGSYCMPTGFKCIDYTLNGGFKSGDLIIIGAKKGGGKTTFAIQLLENIAKYRGLPVGIFSLELEKEELITRMLYSDTEIDEMKSKFNDITEKQWTKLDERMGYIGDARIYVDDNKENNITDICTNAEKLMDEVDDISMIIIVDYFQLIKKNEKYVHSQSSTIIKDLKTLAKELDIAVILLSELPSSIDCRADKSPRLTDLRCFHTIQQYADTIILLHSDDSNEENEHDCENTDLIKVTTEFTITENRKGTVYTVPLLLNKETGRFEEVEIESFDFPLEYISNWQSKQDSKQLKIEITKFNTDDKKTPKYTEYAWGFWQRHLKTDKIPKLECPNCKEIAFTPTRVVGSHCTGNHTISGYCVNCGFEHTNLKNLEYYKMLYKLLKNDKDKGEYIY